MHNIFIEKPYNFVPPYTWHWPQRFLTKIGKFKGLLRKDGVVDHECRNLDRLRDSINAGHGIVLAPNHPRTTDPISMYHLCRETPVSMYTMASWHLFNQSAFETFMVRLMGAFSVNREGLDRKAVDYAIDVLVKAERPLLIFPAGSTSRTNDRLMAFMEGPAFIARTAAKRRAKKDDGKVVAHPICIKYFYQGDIEKVANDVLTRIEKQLSWAPDPSVPLIDRIVKVGDAMLTLKELEFDVRSAPGTSLRERQTNMVNLLLGPLEEEWLGAVAKDGGIQARVKNLRMKIFPELSRREVDRTERARRWKHLERTYLAQQIDCYPEQYLTEFKSVDRILETLEKYEEDLFEHCRIHGNLKVVIDVGEAIEVPTKRDRSAEFDPLMAEIRDRIDEMLTELQKESRLYEGPVGKY